ncbi:MAG: hypothetical protein R6X10_18230, partial [Desulfobacterales bacterium]
IKENYQRITDDRRSFDIRFWQSQGDLAIFEAVMEMLNDYFSYPVLILSWQKQRVEDHKIR